MHSVPVGPGNRTRDLALPALLPIAPISIGGTAMTIQPIAATYDNSCALCALLDDSTR